MCLRGHFPLRRSALRGLPRGRAVAADAVAPPPRSGLAAPPLGGSSGAPPFGAEIRPRLRPAAAPRVALPRAGAPAAASVGAADSAGPGAPPRPGDRRSPGASAALRPRRRGGARPRVANYPRLPPGRLRGPRSVSAATPPPPAACRPPAPPHGSPVGAPQVAGPARLGPPDPARVAPELALALLLPPSSHRQGAEPAATARAALPLHGAGPPAAAWHPPPSGDRAGAKACLAPLALPFGAASDVSGLARPPREHGWPRRPPRHGLADTPLSASLHELSSPRRPAPAAPDEVEHPLIEELPPWLLPSGRCASSPPRPRSPARPAPAAPALLRALAVGAAAPGVEQPAQPNDVAAHHEARDWRHRQAAHRPAFAETLAGAPSAAQPDSPPVWRQSSSARALHAASRLPRRPALHSARRAARAPLAGASAPRLGAQSPHARRGATSPAACLRSPASVLGHGHRCCGRHEPGHPAF
mmetsp:Transcript_54142/g.97544  ORF Transcript_54142/g.97544 Transcript_54142/m.97544 type:complete len:473 (-) Transcript_54142:39-1457(-)